MSVFRFVMLLAVTVMLMSGLSVGALAAPSSQTSAATDSNWQMVQQDILERYGIVVANRTATWSMDELVSVRSGLSTIAAEFSAIVGHDAAPTLKDLLHGAVFYRDRASDRIAYTVAGAVYVYDLWTTYDQTGRAFYLAHEIGHLLDTRTAPLHLFMGEISAHFAQVVGAYADDQGNYQLGGRFPQAGPGGTLRHRSDSAAEDWAESFATVLVPAFEADLRNIGAARQTEVRGCLAKWSMGNT